MCEVLELQLDIAQTDEAGRVVVPREIAAANQFAEGATVFVTASTAAAVRQGVGVGAGNLRASGVLELGDDGTWFVRMTGVRIDG
jgi:hypothetical protein